MKQKTTYLILYTSHLGNLPYNVSKEDVMSHFHKSGEFQINGSKSGIVTPIPVVNVCGVCIYVLCSICM